MLNQKIGVSLAQKNEVDLNSKLDIFAGKNIVSMSQFKNDFESALKKSDHKDSFKSETKVDKSKKDLNSEFKIESKKSKQSSGTNKKKMTERKDSSISNNMASSENVIEIPDKTNDLASEENQIQDKIEGHSVQNSLKNGIQNKNEATIVNQTDSLDSSKIKIDDDEVVMQPVEDFEKSSFKNLEQNISSEFNLESQSALESDAQVGLDTGIKTSDNGIPIEFLNSMDKELAEQVGFQAAAKAKILDDQLLNQLQKFEVEKGITPEAIKPFELAVLQQLQQLNDERLMEAHFQKQNLSSLDSMNLKDHLQTNDASLVPFSAVPNSNDLLSSEKENFENDSGNSKDHNDEGSGKNLDSSLMSEMKSDLNSDTIHLGQSQQSFRSEMNSASIQSNQLDSATQKSQNSEDNLDQNIQEIMSKSHFLAKAGGGEMHVKMSPDGLSEVHLKVLLNDGRVNIEMQTQDRSLKKLLEDSLGELKSGLAHQQLKVDNVRIETVMPTQTDNSTQFQFKEKNNHSDHKQRELWNQLQNNISSKALNSGLKKEYNNKSLPETSSLRTYGGTKGSQFNKVA